MSDNKIGLLTGILIIIWWILFFIFYPFLCKYLGIPDNTPKTRDDNVSYIWFMVILIGSCVGIPLLYALVIALIRSK